MASYFFITDLRFCQVESGRVEWKNPLFSFLAWTSKEPCDCADCHLYHTWQKIDMYLSVIKVNLFDYENKAIYQVLTSVFIPRIIFTLWHNAELWNSPAGPPPPLPKVHSKGFPDQSKNPSLRTSKTNFCILRKRGTGWGRVSIRKLEWHWERGFWHITMWWLVSHRRLELNFWYLLFSSVHFFRVVLVLFLNWEGGWAGSGFYLWWANSALGAYF